MLLFSYTSTNAQINFGVSLYPYAIMQLHISTQITSDCRSYRRKYVKLYKIKLYFLRQEQVMFFFLNLHMLSLLFFCSNFEDLLSSFIFFNDFFLIKRAWTYYTKQAKQLLNLCWYIIFPNYKRRFKI